MHRMVVGGLVWGLAVAVVAAPGAAAAAPVSKQLIRKRCTNYDRHVLARGKLEISPVSGGQHGYLVTVGKGRKRSRWFAYFHSKRKCRALRIGPTIRGRLGPAGAQVR